MSLEKSFRAFICPMYDPTESIAATDEEVIEFAQLNTDDRAGLDIQPIFEDEYWPKSVMLRVRLIPVPFQAEQNQIPATFAINETTCASTLFYGSDHQEGQLLNNCYAGIDLVYCGIGNQGDAFTLRFLTERPDLLYHKAFPVQRVPNIMCSQRHKGAAQWLISTHTQQQLKENEVPILSYGGIYNHHMPLESVIPIYATLAGSQEHKTLVALKSQRFWHDKGVFENQPGQLGDSIYAFHDPTTREETLSLAAVINSGFVKIRLESDEESQIYQSRRYQSLSDSQGLIDITFVPII